MKEKLFKFLNICRKIFFYIYALFIIWASLLMIFIEYFFIWAICDGIISDFTLIHLYQFIGYVLFLIYFNWHLFLVIKHTYLICKNKNVNYKNYLISLSFIFLYYVYIWAVLIAIFPHVS